MKKILIPVLLCLVIFSCNNSENSDSGKSKRKSASIELKELAEEVRNETLRTWKAYKKYAWGHDVLKPMSRSYSDWYEKPLFISPIDAYSTLILMGFDEEAKEIETYVVDSLDFNQDIYAKIFEVNIRILGGLLAMYGISENSKVLDKAVDFANRMLPAFDTGTGIPKYWVNLKTGHAKGDTVNVAEAATYTMEMGILSYYTKDPKYYQAGKKASMAIFERRSEIGLPGEIINVENGEWVSTLSHICAGVDSYYEYLYKSFLLFNDPDLGNIWGKSIDNIHKYISEEYDEMLWYGRVDMNTGERKSEVVTLYDAFFPAILVLSGDSIRASKYHDTWDWLWNKYGLEPMIYDYKTGNPNYPVYDLNPEIIESAYYLFSITGDTKYIDRNKSYWSDIKKYCRTEVAFTSVKNVETMEKKDYMPTFFFAETLKYLFLTFTSEDQSFKFDDYIFNTEAHQFQRKSFDVSKSKEYLGFE